MKIFSPSFMKISKKQLSAHEHASDSQVSQSDIFRFFRNVSYEPGEMVRIRSMLRPSGRTLILPYDQFIEHDCRHLNAESNAGNPDYIMKLAVDGGYNGVAVHYGIAKRFWAKWEGQVPLILKINGKTSFPSQARALSVYTSYVEDGVRIGASGIGYTMYYGSPRQDEDLPQLATVRKLCDQYGMPLIVWAYPRGEAVDAKGGVSSSYALESAARMAMEMGASIIKSNVPKAMKPEFLDVKDIPQYYRDIEKELVSLPSDAQMKERARRVVKAASGIPVLFSGGEEVTEDQLRTHSQACIDAGCFGFIFGRNMWKRPYETAMRMTKELSELLDK